MKKRKKEEQESPCFKNRPFKALKKIAPIVNPVPAAPPNRLTDSPEEVDDETLFQRAFAGVKSLDPGAQSPFSRPGSVSSAPFTPENDQKLFLETMGKIGAAFREESAEEEIQPRSVSSRMRQLRRGSIRISSELDLHGYVREEALQRLSFFVSEAWRKKRKAVLVITGKGINSPDGPVLQGAVADWLRGKGASFVAEFQEAPRDRGGSGAYVVFLRA